MVFDVAHKGCKEQLILQLSWGMYKKDGTLLKMKDDYSEPTDVLYSSPRASDKHHIACEALLHKPNELKFGILLSGFMTYLTKCETLVAHNMKNELSTFNNELLRRDMNKIDMSTFCTINTNQNIS